MRYRSLVVYALILQLGAPVFSVETPRSTSASAHPFYTAQALGAPSLICQIPGLNQTRISTGKTLGGHMGPYHVLADQEMTYEKGFLTYQVEDSSQGNQRTIRLAVEEEKPGTVFDDVLNRLDVDYPLIHLVKKHRHRLPDRLLIFEPTKLHIHGVGLPTAVAVCRTVQNNPMAILHEMVECLVSFGVITRDDLLNSLPNRSGFYLKRTLRPDPREEIHQLIRQNQRFISQALPPEDAGLDRDLTISVQGRLTEEDALKWIRSQNITHASLLLTEFKYQRDVLGRSEKSKESDRKLFGELLLKQQESERFSRRPLKRISDGRKLAIEFGRSLLSDSPPRRSWTAEFGALPPLEQKNFLLELYATYKTWMWNRTASDALFDALQLYSTTAPDTTETVLRSLIYQMALDIEDVFAAPTTPIDHLLKAEPNETEMLTRPDSFDPRRRVLDPSFIDRVTDIESSRTFNMWMSRYEEATRRQRQFEELLALVYYQNPSTTYSLFWEALRTILDPALRANAALALLERAVSFHAPVQAKAVQQLHALLSTSYLAVDPVIQDNIQDAWNRDLSYASVASLLRHHVIDQLDHLASLHAEILNTVRLAHDWLPLAASLMMRYADLEDSRSFDEIASRVQIISGRTNLPSVAAEAWSAFTRCIPLQKDAITQHIISGLSLPPHGHGMVESLLFPMPESERIRTLAQNPLFRSHPRAGFFILHFFRNNIPFLQAMIRQTGPDELRLFALSLLLSSRDPAADDPFPFDEPNLREELFQASERVSRTFINNAEAVHTLVQQPVLQDLEGRMLMTATLWMLQDRPNEPAPLRTWSQMKKIGIFLNNGTIRASYANANSHLVIGGLHPNGQAHTGAGILAVMAHELAHLYASHALGLDSVTFTRGTVHEWFAHLWERMLAHRLNFDLKTALPLEPYQLADKNIQASGGFFHEVHQSAAALQHALGADQLGPFRLSVAMASIFAGKSGLVETLTACIRPVMTAYYSGAELTIDEPALSDRSPEETMTRRRYWLDVAGRQRRAGFIPHPSDVPHLFREWGLLPVLGMIYDRDPRLEMNKVLQKHNQGGLLGFRIEDGLEEVRRIVTVAVASDETFITDAILDYAWKTLVNPLFKQNPFRSLADVYTREGLIQWAYNLSIKNFKKHHRYILNVDAVKSVLKGERTVSNLNHLWRPATNADFLYLLPLLHKLITVVIDELFATDLKNDGNDWTRLHDLQYRIQEKSRQIHLEWNETEWDKEVGGILGMIHSHPYALAAAA